MTCLVLSVLLLTKVQNGNKCEVFVLKHSSEDDKYSKWFQVLRSLKMHH